MNVHPWHRRLCRAGALAVAASVVPATLVSGLPSADASTSAAAAQSARRIVAYTVRPGDTATGLAVRFHAWTAELIRLNHLGPRATLYVGERIRIPVVVRRAGTTRAHHAIHHHATHHASHATGHPAAVGTSSPSRSAIRRLIVANAHARGVDPRLALAVAWQESGWQMGRTSSAGAIGVMQVMPDTGVWMSMYSGRHLNLYRVGDNVLAGVLLLRVLDDLTHSTRQQVAAYYQGIGSVQRGVLLAETKRYVANVLAIRHRLQEGWVPS